MLRERDDLLVMLRTRRMPLLFAARIRPRAFRRAGHRVYRGAAVRRRAQARMVAGEKAIQDLTGIDEQMKAVSDLFRLRAERPG